MQLACIIAYFSVPALSIVAARCVYVILLYCRWETISRAYLQWRQSEITYMAKYVLYGVSKYERLLCAVGLSVWNFCIQWWRRTRTYHAYSLHSVGYRATHVWKFRIFGQCRAPPNFIFILFHIYSCLYVWMSTLLFLIPLIYTVLNMNLKACDIKTLNSWLQSDLCVFFNLLSELPSPLLFPLVHLVLR